MLTAYLWTLGIASVLEIILFGYDKVAANDGRMRIPVSVLLVPVALGGAAGALLSMLLFRHKTRKWYFRIPILFCLAVQALTLSYLLMYKGVSL